MDKDTILKTFNDLNNEQLVILYKYYNTKFKKNNVVATLNASKNDPKYITLLLFINTVLCNANLPVINDLTQFVNINRNIFVTDTNYNALITIKDNILKHFYKTEIKWIKHTIGNDYVLFFVRAACKSLGLKLLYKRKEVYTKINDKNYRTFCGFYSII